MGATVCDSCCAHRQVQAHDVQHYLVENLVILNTLMLAGQHILWWRNDRQSRAVPNTEMYPANSSRSLPSGTTRRCRFVRS